MLLPSAIQINRLHHFTGHSAGIFCMDQGYSPHSVFTGAGDGVIAEWDLTGKEITKAIARIPGNIFSLLHIAEKNLLVAGDMHGYIYFIRPGSETGYTVLHCDNKAVYDLQLSGTVTLLAACGSGTLYCIDLSSGKIIRSIPVTDKSIRHICLAPSGKTIVLACSDHLLHVLEAKELRETLVITGHENSVFCATFSPDGKKLISGSRDAHLMVWDAENDFMPMQRIPAHRFTINDIRFSPDGRLFATAGRDKHIKIWDAEHFNLLKVIDAEKFGGHINSVNKLFWSRWNNCLISCGDDRSVMVWDIRIRE